MLSVVYSNRTEELLRALARDLAAARPAAGAGLLAATHLVAPDRYVATYVKLGVARLTGLCANLEVHYLKRFFQELVAGAGARLVDAATLQGLVLAVLLDDERLAAAELAPARAYVEAVADPGARDLRRYQLAERLAHLFEEYELGRPELLDGWLAAARPARGRGRRRRAGDPGAWQRRVWLEIMGPAGLLAQRTAAGPRWVTVRELLGDEPPLRLEDLAPPPRLYLFGFSYLATSYLRLLARVARAAAVRVYAPQPCREEPAALAPASLAAVALDGADPFGLLSAAPGGAAGLARWGRPGREHLRLLGRLGATAVEAAPAGGPAAATAAAPRTLLERLQRDLGERRGPDAAVPRGAGDDSLTILACPSPRREAEVVASEIWRLCAADPTLRFNEIAVVVAGGAEARYLPHLQAAFRECHGLPHSLADLPLAGESPVAQAVDLLLRLPLGTYTRPELLRLATHPAVLRATFPDADPAAWRAWCHTLGIVHGADHGDHAGTYIARDILNWDQGLRRLALGVFMAGERSGDARTFSLGDDSYLVEEPADADAAAQLGLLVRSLIADSRQLRAARLPLGEWARVLGELVTTYVAAGNPAEEAARHACVRALAGIERVAPGDRAVSYRIAHEAARAALGGLCGSRGRAFADGVVVSTLRPMRAVPFRVVFVMALGEGAFPASDARDHLDLRGAARRAGDVSPRERDQYLFLETLLAARERLYLAYVDRDQLTGATLPPSAVLVELEHLLAQGYLDAAGLAARRVRHPLRRYDERYFGALYPAPAAGAPPPLPPPLVPAARAEAQASALRRHLARHVGGALPDGVAARLALLAPPAAAQVAADLGGLEPPAPPPVAPGMAPPVRVSLGALRRFLECPLQGHAGFVLGLAEEEEDVLAVADEPFATEFPAAVALVREVLTEALVRGLAPAALHAAAAGRRELQGAAPTGLLGEEERAQQREWLAAWLGQLAPAGAPPPPARVIRFGGAAEHAMADVVAPPLVLDLELDDALGPRAQRVEITGATAPLAAAGDASLILTARGAPAGELPRAKLLKDVLRGFLDHVLLAATATRADVRREVWVCLRQPGRTRPLAYGLKPLGTAAARAYLGRLVASLLTQAHGYLLPCEAVFLHRARAARAPTRVADCVAEVREEQHYSSTYGPIGLLARYAAPAEDEARAMIAARFGCFFELLEEPAPGATGGNA